MKLSSLVREDFKINGDLNIEIREIKYNSKQIGQGDVFVAIAGTNIDGHDFIVEAIEKGAIAVVYETSRYKPLINRNITWIGVSDSRDALAWIANKFYGEPSKKLHLVGITGTNGKTTSSYLIREILKKKGEKTGLIGTIKYLIEDEQKEAQHTTPESLQFQRLLSEMVNRGISYVVSEVSSHALFLRRVDYSNFEVAVFTNLSRDHLDFHKDMEDYFLSKRRLFSELLRKDGVAIINIDDDYGRRLSDDLNCRKILYSLENKDSDIFVKNYRLLFNGTELTVAFKDREYYLKTKLLGIPNIYNTLCAISVGLYYEISWDIIKAALVDALAPEGRFENIDEGQQFLVFVDYAHTPDALERLIKSVIKLREEIGNRGRIITLFGCGGNRDRGKRPQMGKIATELSDFVILTSDNPRWEEPRQIIRDIEEGISRDNFIVASDRMEAIRIGLMMCERGDIFIVAGKGHETYQEIRGERIPFNDREIIRGFLRGK